MRLYKIRYHFVLVMVLAELYSYSCVAGGVSLGTTRVIYPQDAKEVSLSLSNSDEKQLFLIQSWVEDAEGQSSSDFVITPPLFVSRPQGENIIKLRYVGERLDSNKEHVYWLNSKSIPSTDREETKGRNILQFAVLSRIKVFVRPKGLDISSFEAPEYLAFTKTDNGIQVANLSPYYITVVNLKVDGQASPNKMLAPYSEYKVDISESSVNMVTYQTINDYGANSTERKFVF